ncbi:MAG: hypothetical protein ACKN9R_05355 [Candidatus Limnocylindrus sp.]
MRNIALIGPQKAGKSTLAMYLMMHRNYERLGIADEIKRLVTSAHPAFDKHDTYPIRTFNGEEAISGRELLQQLGAAMREVDRDFLLRCLEHKYRNAQKLGSRIVIDDVRLDREVAFLRHLDPSIVVVRVTASPLVRERRSGGALNAINDVTEIAWMSVEADLVLDTTDTEPEDAYRQLVAGLEEL